MSTTPGANPKPANQRPNNLSDYVANVTQALSAAAQGQAQTSQLPQYANLSETIGETDTLSSKSTGGYQGKLSETVGETDALSSKTGAYPPLYDQDSYDEVAYA